MEDNSNHPAAQIPRRFDVFKWKYSPFDINIENIDIENEYRNNIDILGVEHYERKRASGDESRGF